MHLFAIQDCRFWNSTLYFQELNIVLYIIQHSTFQLVSLQYSTANQCHEGTAGSTILQTRTLGLEQTHHSLLLKVVIFLAVKMAETFLLVLKYST